MTDRLPKAEGMSWLTPYLVVRDIKKSLEFYEKVFGFKINHTIPDKDGNLIHGDLTYRDCTIMLGPEVVEAGEKAPSTLSGSPVSFYLYVDNVDEFFETGREAGAEVIEGLKDQYWGDWTCQFRCPEGYTWIFAQCVADLDPSKMPNN